MKASGFFEKFESGLQKAQHVLLFKNPKGNSVGDKETVFCRVIGFLGNRIVGVNLFFFFFLNDTTIFSEKLLLFFGLFYFSIPCYITGS